MISQAVDKDEHQAQIQRSMATTTYKQQFPQPTVSSEVLAACGCLLSHACALFYFISAENCRFLWDQILRSPTKYCMMSATVCKQCTDIQSVVCCSEKKSYSYKAFSFLMLY